MGSAGEDEIGGTTPPVPADRARLDRRAEALRANLKRRKAQTRARDEVRRAAPRSPEPTPEG